MFPSDASDAVGKEGSSAPYRNLLTEAQKNIRKVLNALASVNASWQNQEVSIL